VVLRHHKAISILIGIILRPATCDYADFHVFIGFLPPLRRPNTLKHLAGLEIGGGNFLSDTSPEDKAAELRGQSTTHYREQELET
jgi:galactose-1-phosphate uridylyltransferase